MTLYRFGQIISKPFVHLYCPFKVEGRENIPEQGGYVICSNHQNMLDPVFLGSVIREPFAAMGKEELFDIPVLKRLIKRLGAFPVARGKNDMEAIRFAIDTVKEKRPVLIFPEGTREKKPELGAFKSGAAFVAINGEVPVLPAAVVTPKGFGMFRPLTVRFGKPITVDELRGEDKKNSSMYRHATELIRERVSSLMDGMVWR